MEVDVALVKFTAICGQVVEIDTSEEACAKLGMLRSEDRFEYSKIKGSKGTVRGVGKSDVQDGLIYVLWVEFDDDDQKISYLAADGCDISAEQLKKIED